MPDQNSPVPPIPITPELQANYQKWIEICRDNPRDVAKQKLAEFFRELEEKAKTTSNNGQ